MTARKILPSALAVLLLGTTNGGFAATLLECQDARLATIGSQQLLESLQTAGGLDCRLQSEAWGDSVSCERVGDGTAYGLKLKEIAGEVHDSGLRSISVVATSNEARAHQAMTGLSPAAGLRTEVEPREDGVVTIRCIAEPPGAATDANAGVIGGQVPALPPGASGWSVCAQPSSGDDPVCAMADLQTGEYLIDGLVPGSYGVLATPRDAIDPLLRAMLIRSGAVGETREGGPKVVAETVNVRSGAKTAAPGLTLLRLPAGG